MKMEASNLFANEEHLNGTTQGSIIISLNSGSGHPLNVDDTNSVHYCEVHCSNNISKSMILNLLI